VANRDFFGGFLIRIIGKIFSELVVKGNFALLRELPERDLGENFVD
jgi:hypothetical protein